MIDRTLQPPLSPITKINFVEPTIIPINPFAKMYWMSAVLDETTRIEFHFNAGSIRGNEKLAGSVNNLIFSGTPSKTSTQIHEELDGLGAFIDQELGQEVAIVSLYCLRKNAKAAVELVIDSIQNVCFHEQEVADTIREKKQQYLISSEKVNILARREFQKQLFANSPNYARQIELKDYDAITVEGLQKFHKEFYLKGLLKVVLVGYMEEEFVNFLQNNVSPLATQTIPEYEKQFINNKGVFHIEKEDAVQTAIRIGMPLFNKTHPDFIDFQIVQTILGDYFGSRLMSNIREDKGYTYGIGSGLSEANKTGYFIIATEVGKEFVSATLHEIKVEIERLQNELVEEEELTLVKNYMLGQLLKHADGPNAMMDLFMSVQLQGLGFEFYTDFIQRVNTITADELKQIANNYLFWDSLTIITAGSSN
jgi:predicted Zn-dependent peptidase